MATEAEEVRGIGHSVKRKEDDRFIQGKGNYVDDIKLPGMLHMAILRSPLAHAKINSIDTTAASAVPGVVAVVTGELHPVQRAFHEEHALQCGYCTPGMIMSAAYLLEQNPDPSEQEVRLGLEGNLCRCTGYQNIVNAVLAAAKG